MISTDNGLVTVVIPTYNRTDLLGEALSSVFAQTYRNFEIIVVDDGSTDNTASTLLPLVKHGLIQYVYQNNQGESAARNRGIVEAKGQYIAFLDSDDLFEPLKLEIQVEYLKAYPELGLVHSGFSKFDNDGHDLGYRDPSWFSGNIYPDILLYWTTLMAVDAVLIPKKVFEVVGLFDETLKMGPDLDMWRRISRYYLFGYIPRRLARVRVHEGNISGDKINATEGFVHYLEKAFVDDPGLSKQFKVQAFSRMYSTQAYNLLSRKEDRGAQIARSNAKRSIEYDPLNIHGYIALLATIFGYNLRNSLILLWRLLRSELMSRKRLD